MNEETAFTELLAGNNVTELLAGNNVTEPRNLVTLAH
jgi:hypothetical protein